MFKKKYIYIFLGCLVIFGWPVGYFLLEESFLFFKPNVNQTQDFYKNTIVYLINLDESIDRYKHILPRVKKLDFPFERISAINGKTLSEEEIYQKVDFEAYQLYQGHFPKRGTIGCSLSHIKTWQTFLNSSYKYAFILEDDINFNPDHIKNLLINLTQHFQGWDIISFESSRPGLALTLENLNNKDLLVLYLLKVVHTGAYLLTRSTAEKLLRKALPIRLPIDYYFTRGWELDFVFMGIEPRPIQQNREDLTSQSIIKSTSNHYSVKPYSKQKNFVKRCIYKIQSTCIRFYYNLKLYIRNQIKPLILKTEE